MKIFLLFCSIALASQTIFAQQETLNVSGEYNTNFGVLTLTQNGKSVVGAYSYKSSNGTMVGGTLKGTLKGATLTFTWKQVQGESNASGNGKFVFEEDGKSYKGTWKDSKGKTGVWFGSRQ